MALFELPYLRKDSLIEDIFLLDIARWNLLWFRRVFQLSLLVEHTVGSTQHDELRTTVQLVAYLLLFLVEFLDELLAEDVVLLEPRVFLGEFLTYRLRLLLSVAYRCQSVGGYAVSYEVVNNSLCTML